MKTLLTVLCILLGLTVKGQYYAEEFTSNNFNWSQSNDGRLFNNAVTGLPGLKVPANESNYSLLFSGFLFGGYDSNSQIRVSIRTLRCPTDWYPTLCNFSPGPARLNGTAVYGGAAHQQFDRFWKITRSEVDLHVEYFNCFYDQNCDVNSEFPSGYEIPEAFLTWPVYVQDEIGYASNTASFFDYNGDGAYNPELGDHPNICGDFSVYSVYNDVAPDHYSPISASMGIEVHTTIYSYEPLVNALFNTLFVQHKVINRSDQIYTDTYAGLYTDFDLGNPLDDYIGTDVSRSMIFAYNGDNYDEGSTQGPGYGSDLPVMAIKYLGGAYQDADGMDNSPYAGTSGFYGNQTSGWGDGIVDNERLGLSSSIHPSLIPNSPNYFGSEQIHLYHMMRGIWNDGTTQTFGGNGYDPEELTAAKYCYPGISDPLLVGTVGIDPEFPHPDGWTEGTALNPSGDRSMFSSTGPFTFAPGDVQYLDYAYIFARDSHEPGEDVFETIRTYTDAVVGVGCGQQPDIITGTNAQLSINNHIRIYPNPASELIVIELQTVNARFFILDAIGREVLRGHIDSSKSTVNISTLKPGLYFVNIQGEGFHSNNKLVIR